MGSAPTVPNWGGRAEGFADGLGWVCCRFYPSTLAATAVCFVGVKAGVAVSIACIEQMSVGRLLPNRTRSEP
jgi:hypothetical protein